MKRLAWTSWMLLVVVILNGCGGAGGGASAPFTQALRNVAGNWQFSMTSTIAGTPPLLLAGSINQSDRAVSSAMHLDGSNCFDPLTTVGLTGSLTDGNSVSLTSTSVDGQVVAFSGNTTDTAFTGTYTIAGGCADADKGTVTGTKIPAITGTLNGTFTTSGNATFDVVAQVTQGGASFAGTFGLTGTATFSTPCFSSGTIKQGTFPSGSFIIGTSVALEIETDNGAVAFRGTANQATGEISGFYTVQGGTCDDSGTAVLVAAKGPWDY
jgi:hypothetical protein